MEEIELIRNKKIKPCERLDYDYVTEKGDMKSYVIGNLNAFGWVLSALSGKMNIEEYVENQIEYWTEQLKDEDE
jgi:hypothetical protein